VNIDTDCRLAIAGQFRRVAAENRAEFDPRRFLKPSLEAMQTLCRERFELFGAAGQAAKITPLPPAAMAERYRRGQLDPQIAKTTQAA
jgi:fructose-bisphosphate aldolase class II